MKIGIVTLVSDNYGNKYQNYAVEQLLSEFGDVITYQAENKPRSHARKKRAILQKLTPSRISASISARLMNCYDITNARRTAFANLLFFLTHRTQIIASKQLRHKKFISFQAKYLHISDRIITTENCYDEPWNHSHDFFVCGSDQIWNPYYGTTSELAFLSFAHNRNIALSPSFGVSEVPESLHTQFSTWLSDVRNLSVRESAGQKIIKELTGRDAEVLLDPTMAIPSSHWEKLATPPSTKLPEKYILTYFLGRMTDSYHNRILHISEQLNLPIINLFDIEQPEYYSFDPCEVLYAIRNADWVLTDSFHGTVFSILFQRNFLVFYRDEGGESMHSRIETLLIKFALKSRLDSETHDLLSISDAKWSKIQEVLASERNKTQSYLRQSLNQS